MMAGTKRVLLAAQAAVWTFLNQVVGEPIDEPVEVTVQQPGGDLEVQLVLRRNKEGGLVFPGPCVPLEELSRFLCWFPGGGLSAVERDVVQLFRNNGNSRRQRRELRDELQKYSEPTINNTTARLSRREVGILEEDRSAHPPGFHLAPGFCRYLEWCDELRSRLRLPPFLVATA
jgi:hypothetical protein